MKIKPGALWPTVIAGALGLLVAIVSFFPDTTGVLEAVVAAIIINDLAGGWWMRRQLAAAGEDRCDP